MPVLVWDQVGRRNFEAGLDRGVLYTMGGVVVPWNGLVSVVEAPEPTTETVYFDGMMVNEIVTAGNYKATMKAITYPVEFEEIEGSSYDRFGVSYNNQQPKPFNLSYRTFAGNDLDPDAGYKIHLIYNLFAVPAEKSYATNGENPTLMEFEWTISAVPQEVAGHRPTAHITIDSRKVDPVLLEQIEEMLWGSETAFAELPTMQDFLDLLNTHARIAIIDNGDGTWAAVSDIPGLVIDNGDGTFEINEVDAVYLDADTYQVSTTSGAADAPLIALELYGDGQFIITTANDTLLDVNPDGTWTLYNVDAEFAGPDMYRIRDTFA